MRKPMPFGKYLLLDRIAVGGMAEVFAAKAFGVEGFERIVAIKRILPNMVEDDEFIAMFIDEARIAALLTHANIAQIYELGRHDETYYIAMEYVSGRDVRLLIDKFRKKGQTVPLPMAAYILAKIAEGLDYAHTKTDQDGQPLGIIHRDISPQNVLVSYGGDVKLIDFGIAKAAGRNQKTQAGILKGKFAYMSPEQVRGIPTDSRSDIFSAGVMLYEMITGAKLFSGESDFSTLEKVRVGTVRAPSELNAAIPEQLERIVLKALAKDRDERYQTGEELHDDLMRFLFAGKDIYSGKNLAAFMREAFLEEFRKEEDRIRRWQATAAEDSADFESTRSTPSTGSPGVGKSGQKVRIGARSTPRRSSTDFTPEPGFAPRRDLADLEAAVDEMATQVKSRSDIDDGATAIISRADVERPPAGKKEKEPAPQDPHETTSKIELGPSRPLPSKKPVRRRGRAISVMIGVAALFVALSLAAAQLNRAVPGVVIRIKEAPQDVQILIDNAPQRAGVFDDVAQFEFRSPGLKHSIRIVAAGFKALDQTFSLPGDGRPLEFSLVKEEPAPSAPTPPPVPEVVLDAGSPQPQTHDAGHVASAVEPSPKSGGRDAAQPEVAQVIAPPAYVDAGPPTHIVIDAVPPAPPPVVRAAIEFVSTPPGATIIVDGKKIANLVTPATVPDEPMDHALDIKFLLKGYRPFAMSFTPSGKGDKVSAELVPMGGAAALSASPTKVAEEATKPAVKEPVIQQVMAATPEKPVVKPPDEVRPVVEAGGKATLKVMCTPRAKVLVDDKMIGRSSPPAVSSFTIDPGAHQVVCESETGSRSVAKQVTIGNGESGEYRARVP